MTRTASAPSPTAGAWVLGLGRPCLDLTATLGRRHTSQLLERLPDDDALAAWLVAAGLLPTRPLTINTPQLIATRQLREAVNRLIRTQVIGRLPGERGTVVGPAAPRADDEGLARDDVAARDIALINRSASQPDLTPQLALSTIAADRLLNLGVIWTAEHAVEAALSTLARDAIALLAGPQAKHVKECAHPDCSLLFLDDSQAHRRRWCSMNRCGNLTKIANYRSQRPAASK